MSVTVKYAGKIADMGAGQKAIINAAGQKMSSDITIAPVSASETVDFTFTAANYVFIAGDNAGQSGVHGIQYANEEIRINDDITLSTHNNGCWLTTQFRLYDVLTSNKGWAIIHSEKTVSSLMLNIGYKKCDLHVFGSTGDGRGDYVNNSTADNGEWEYIGTITTNTTSYKSYLLEIDKTKGYKHILIDADGAQMRIKSMTLTVESEATGASETVTVIYNDKHIAEFDSKATATLNCADKIMQGAVVVIVNSADETAGISIKGG